MTHFDNFLNAIPFYFKDTRADKNKKFHELLKMIYEVFDFWEQKFNHKRDNTFNIDSSGEDLEFLAKNFFGIERGAMTDDEVRAELLFLLFCKGGDGSNSWLLNFVKKVINPIDCFFLSKNMEVVFYFNLKEPLSEWQKILLKKVKTDGVGIKAFYVLNKQIFASMVYDILPIYANAVQLEYNSMEAIALLKPGTLSMVNAPLEECNFFYLDDEGKPQTDFIEII